MHLGTYFNHLTRHFMTEHYTGVRPRQLAGAVHQIVMTHTSGFNAHQHFMSVWLWCRHRLKLQLLGATEIF